MSSRSVALFALALVWIATWSSTVRAQARQSKADTRMTEVKRACVAGEVDKAVALLAELYAETNDPTAIYNQGRCYQQNARPEPAVMKFQEYLRKAKDLTPADRAEVETFIKELNEDIERSKPPAPVSTVAIPTPARDEHPGSGLRKLGIGLGALGVVAVGAGIVFGVKLEQKEDEINAKTKAPGVVDGKDTLGPNADGKRYETMQFVAYGVGVVALAAGTTYYILGARREAGSRAVVAPLAAPGVGGVSLAGTF